jgi:hypothetical protein
VLLESRDGFKMKRITYFLVSMTIWAQFDDVLLAPASVVLSAPLASDDDEYVPSEGREEQSWLISLPQRQSVGVASEAVAPFRGGMSRRPCEWEFATPFAPPPIYVFMSLQI